MADRQEDPGNLNPLDLLMELGRKGMHYFQGAAGSPGNAYTPGSPPGQTTYVPKNVMPNNYVSNFANALQQMKTMHGYKDIALTPPTAHGAYNIYQPAMSQLLAGAPTGAGGVYSSYQGD